MSKATTSKERILAAATAIAVEHGPKQLTLDNVAKKCGLSKGGLMHHFSSKEALLKSMTENMLRKCEEHSELLKTRHRDALTITNVIRTKKFINEIIGMNEAKILLVAAIENHELLSSVKAAILEQKEAIMSEPKSEMATLLMLASDGLAFQELLGVSPFDENERNEIGDKLIEMAIALEGDLHE